MNVIDVIDQACEDMCANYCKYYEEACDLIETGGNLDACKNCPLAKLRG